MLWKLSPPRINRTDKILVSQETTPDSIKRWKRFVSTQSVCAGSYTRYFLYIKLCVIHLDTIACVRDVYKTFLVYKAFLSGNFLLWDPEQNEKFAWIYRDTAIRILHYSKRVECSQFCLLWGIYRRNFSYITVLFEWFLTIDFPAKTDFCKNL